MSGSKITLYHANWSLCSQMVRVALLEKGIDFHLDHIKLCDQYPEGENLSKEFLALNPKATVPVITHCGSVICGSQKIIHYIDSLQGNNDVHLYPQDNPSEFEQWVSDTTITEGVGFAETIGTILPVFSSPLIQMMVKKLPFKSILRILLRHPIKQRKYIFVSMYFFSAAKKFPNLGVSNFIDELMKIENMLSLENDYFGKSFSHIDINMMCLFHRLKDLQLEDILSTPLTPRIRKYWMNLQSRSSYKEGILNYYGAREKQIVDSFHQQNNGELLIKLKDKLYELNNA